MKIRPCIDIHDGCVKQIVGSSLSDDGRPQENYIAGEGAGFFAGLYRDLSLPGGHIILLNKAGTPEYEADLVAAQEALQTFPGGMQIGGGVTAENAAAFLRMGASHVIVTSFVFRDGRLSWENLRALEREVGREHLVLDLSCRSDGERYRIMTDRWQKWTDLEVNEQTLADLADHCDEFLVHAVDAEGKRQGIDRKLAGILGTYCRGAEESSEDQGGRSGIRPVTYAGGIASYPDLDELYEAGDGRVDATIGSALRIFGGTMDLANTARYVMEKNRP